PGQGGAALAALDSIEPGLRRGGDGAELRISADIGAASGAEAFTDSISGALNQVLAQLAAPAQAQADAALVAAQAQQELLTVESPFAGTVSIAQSGGGGAGVPALPPGLGGIPGLPQPSTSPGGGPLRVGSQVIPGQTLFTVYDFSAWYMAATIDEVDIPRIQVGQQVRVTIDAIEAGTFVGIVESVALEGSTTEAGGVGYPVRVRITGPAPDQEPAPDLAGARVGMTGSVDITTATQESNLVVPARSLVRRESGTAVFLVRDGVLREVPVEVVAMGEDRTAVTGNLSPGDTIVVSGAEELMDGQRVTVR
ncbi:MAG: efflux RND transporter periplasmic adaptor subunit, partial [Egibacteraceae bacterium]